MKLRKLISLGLMSTLAATMVVPAFATSTDPAFGTAEEAAGEGTTGTVATEVTSEVNVPVLKISVPTSGTVILNPYKMKYTITGVTTPPQTQIINKTGVLENKTDGIGIVVSCAPTATVPDGVELVATEAEVSTGADADGKQMYLKLDTAAVASAPTDLMAALTSPNSITMGATEADLNETEVNDAKAKLVAADGSSGNKFLAFKVGGKMSEVQGWTTDDTAEISLAWTFAVDIPITTSP